MPDLLTILGLAETCRSSTPGPCRPDWPPFPQWYRVTRRGLDCAFAPERHACYLSRKMLGRPPGPAERHHWAKRRDLARREERAAKGSQVTHCLHWDFD